MHRTLPLSYEALGPGTQEARDYLAAKAPLLWWRIGERTKPKSSCAADPSVYAAAVKAGRSAPAIDRSLHGRVRVVLVRGIQGDDGLGGVNEHGEGGRAWSEHTWALGHLRDALGFDVCDQPSLYVDADRMECLLLVLTGPLVDAAGAKMPELHGAMARVFPAPTRNRKSDGHGRQGSGIRVGGLRHCSFLENTGNRTGYYVPSPSASEDDRRHADELMHEAASLIGELETMYAPEAGYSRKEAAEASVGDLGVAPGIPRGHHGVLTIGNSRGYASDPHTDKSLSGLEVILFTRGQHAAGGVGWSFAAVRPRAVVDLGKLGPSVLVIVPGGHPHGTPYPVRPHEGLGVVIITNENMASAGALGDLADLRKEVVAPARAARGAPPEPEPPLRTAARREACPPALPPALPPPLPPSPPRPRTPSPQSSDAGKGAPSPPGHASGALGRAGSLGTTPPGGDHPRLKLIRAMLTTRAGRSGNATATASRVDAAMKPVRVRCVKRLGTNGNNNRYVYTYGETRREHTRLDKFVAWIHATHIMHPPPTSPASGARGPKGPAGCKPEKMQTDGCDADSAAGLLKAKLELVKRKLRRRCPGLDRQTLDRVTVRSVRRTPTGNNNVYEYRLDETGRPCFSMSKFIAGFSAAARP